MRLGRKMDNAVNVIFTEYPLNRFPIADIRLYELIVLPLVNALQVCEISGVGQLVDIYYPDVVAVFFEHVMNVIAPDKAGSAGHKICMHLLNLPSQDNHSKLPSSPSSESPM